MYNIVTEIIFASSCHYINQTHLNYKNVKIEIILENLYCIYVMFLSSFTYIVILIVQVFSNVDVIECHRYRSIHEPVTNKNYLRNLKNIVQQEAINKRTATMSSEEKFFNHIREDVNYTPYTPKTIAKNQNPLLLELKLILEQLLNKLDVMDTKDSSVNSNKHSTQFKIPTTIRITPKAKESTSKPDVVFRYKKRNKVTGGNTRWEDWTNWSSCSVSCGKGRKIRWRHCVTDCEAAETEMEEKTCQLPACAPGQIFGIKL